MPDTQTFQTFTELADEIRKADELAEEIRKVQIARQRATTMRMLIRDRPDRMYLLVYRTVAEDEACETREFCTIVDATKVNIEDKAEFVAYLHYASHRAPNRGAFLFSGKHITKFQDDRVYLQWDVK